ncbi:2'-5' RNA ligase family protein [Cnuibacter sp. UC19_7]|uniref:2'-5' RNA ligase family protein n=1 Tax=Cnuibacter sp. UC19_7 TaxID=3350166 RepID=UPI00366F5D25
MRSVELTLDEEGDAAVRLDWARLSEAGLPSLADHTGPTNRPHVTLAAGDVLEVESDLLASELAGALPATLTFSGLLLFGARGGRFVLVRALVVSPELVELHRTVAKRVGGAVPNSQPGAWTPHITLARRLTPGQVAVALEALDPSHPAVLADACRWWIGDVKEVRDIVGRGTVGENPTN